MRRATPRKRARTLTKKIKQVIYRAVETKTYGECIAGVLDTNDFNSYELTTIPQNNDPSVSVRNSKEWNTRDGQVYHLVGTSVYMVPHNNPLNGVTPVKPLQFRMLIVEAIKTRNTSPPSSTEVMWIDQLSNNVAFTAMAGTANSMTYKVDKKMYNTLYDKEVKVTGGNGYGQSVIKRWQKVKKDIHCQQMADGSLGQDRMLYLVWFGWDPASVGISEDPCPYGYSFCYKTYWKDP